MMTLDEITKKVLEQIDASGFKQSGAFNLRHNGIALCHGPMILLWGMVWIMMAWDVTIGIFTP